MVMVGETMSRHKIYAVCLVCLGLIAVLALTLCGPPLSVQKGMTYDEVEDVLGKQYHGMRLVSLIDRSWTGLWPGVGGTIEVTFDENNRVRDTPKSLHCFITRMFRMSRIMD
jgi:hypothetical protein